jgi:pilus assembly protein CpaF
MPEREWSELRNSIHQDLLGQLNLQALSQIARSDLKLQLAKPLNEALSVRRLELDAAQREQLIDELLDELIGLGPLEAIMRDKAVSDIVINGCENVFVERHGRMQKADVRFLNNDHVIRILNKIVSGAGRRIDEAQPMVDARLADGSRINAVIPPLALDGPLVSIRRFSVFGTTFKKLEALNTLSPEMSELLALYVSARLNIVVTGGTGSGKTTLLNVLATAIPDAQRVITIEDSAELDLNKPNVARLETRPANMEGNGRVTQRELLRNALRMRPDRIILGEVRGDEAIDMLQAMNTGHDGSMTTVHANDAANAITRIENMVIMSGINLSSEQLARQIGQTVNVVVHVSRYPDGVRRISSINEVSGSDKGGVELKPVFRFEATGVNQNGDLAGHFVGSAGESGFQDRLKMFRPTDQSG